MAGAVAAQESRATVRIRVKAKGDPVAGAQVTFGAESGVTDTNGFVAGSVDQGKLDILVNKQGYLPTRTQLVIDEVREWHVGVDLVPHERVEEEVTVFATRTDKRLQDLPTRVEILSREEIEEKMLMTPGDVVMMLNEMGGLRVQTTSPSLGAASVRIQGMQGRYTRFLTDGLPLFGQQGGGLGLLQIPPTDLGQVEVIKGVSSALYGAGAMAGVVNLISRRPASDPVHEVLLNRSTLGATDGTVFLASKMGSEWGASFLGGSHLQERKDRDDDGWADLARYSRGVVRPRLFWGRGERSSGLLTGGFTYEDRVGGTMPGSVLLPTGDPYREALETRRYDVGGSFQTLAGQRYVVSGRTAASWQHHRHRFGDVQERDRHDLFYGELTARGGAGRHSWVVGSAVEREAYLPRDVDRSAYLYVTPGIFVQDDVDLTSWLSVSAGVRADFHSQYGRFLSPRVAALFRWEGWTSRVSAGQGFFAPTPLTEETEAAGLSRLTIPVPLVAEQGRSASIDLSRAIGPASYTVTIFRSSVRYPIQVERSERYQLVNAGESATNSGVELLGTWRREPFAVTGTYTYVRSREFESGVRKDAPLTPRHSAGIVGMWENEDVGRVGLECYYTGRQRLEENPFRPQSEPYVVVGLLVERRLGPMRIFFNAENLTDARQTRWESLIRPARAVDGRWTVDAWAPLDGRVFNGGIRFQF